MIKDAIKRVFKVSWNNKEVPDTVEHVSYTTDEIEELRQLRNEYNDKASEIQKQIDQKIMDMYEVPDIVGKYIRLCRGEDTLIYKVKQVDGLVNGIKITGSEFDFDVIDTYDNIIIDMSMRVYKSESVIVTWNKIEDIEILDDDAAIDIMNNKVDAFINTIKLHTK